MPLSASLPPMTTDIVKDEHGGCMSGSNEQLHTQKQTNDRPIPFASAKTWSGIDGTKEADAE